MAERSNPRSKQSTQEKPIAGTLAPFHPRLPAPSRFGPLGRLRSEFDRLFDDFFSPTWPTMWQGERDGGWGLDMQDRDDAIVVHADAPGFEPNDFDLQVRDNELVLCASHHAEAKEGDEGYRWQERELCRSVTLPSGIDADKVDAEYHNGVLTVTLPKTEQARGKKIEVKS